MIEEEIQKKFEASFKESQDRQDKKLDAIFHSTEKTRKYFLWTLIIRPVA